MGFNLLKRLIKNLENLQNPFKKDEFSIPGFASEVLEYLEENNIDKAHVVGYSMGGYVGMYLAAHFPDKIRSLVTLATKYHWDEEIAAREIKMLNPEKISTKVPDFAEQLKNGTHPMIGNYYWKKLKSC